MERHHYKKVTITDVAKKAGVSASTVSRVLNNPSIVDADTLNRVLLTTSELGYTSSKLDRFYQVRTKKVLKTIALMIPNDDNPYYQSFLTGFDRKINQIGYLTLLNIYNNETENVEDNLRNLIQNQVDGCILAYLPPDIDANVIDNFVRKIPTVFFQSSYQQSDSIDAEEEEGTYAILEELVKSNHRDIAFVGYFSNLTVYEKRFRAYQRIHEDYNLPLRQEYISEYQGLIGQDMQYAYSEGCRLLSLSHPPTAIHCFNTKTAMGVYAAIRDKNLRIPEDISLSAYDDLPVCNLFTPPLSVVAQPMDAMISTSIDLLMRRINSSADEDPQRVVFPTEIIRRASIGNKIDS